MRRPSFALRVHHTPWKSDGCKQRSEGWHHSPRSQHQQSEICMWHRPNRGKQHFRECHTVHISWQCVLIWQWLLRGPIEVNWLSYRSTKSMEYIWKSKTQKTYTGNNSIQHSAIWVWKLDYYYYYYTVLRLSGCSLNFVQDYPGEPVTRKVKPIWIYRSKR